MTDTALETALFAAAGTKQGHWRHVEPDGAEIHRELKRKHVTLTMLWDEYIERCPEGYRYSRFCELYRNWASRLSITMRQAHTGGDKLFVDYAGDTVPVIVDRLTGQVHPAQIFVAVMGASNFTYAEASWTQALADWIGAHTRAFAAIGGVPKLLVPDNTKVAVIKACLYEPRSIGPTPRWRPIMIPRSCQRDRAGRATRRKSKSRCCSSSDGCSAVCATAASTVWLNSIPRSASCCGSSTTNARSGASVSPVGRCSKSSIGPTSSRCRRGPIALPNGASVGSASITMSSSRAISTASPTTLPGARSRCG